jgi:glycosyltransferase involved in cell wall biosynthesis
VSYSNNRHIDKWSIDYKISVIFPTRNRLELLKKCLDSLLNKSYKKHRLFEIILVVDYDDKQTLDYILNTKDIFQFTDGDLTANSLSVLLTEQSEFMQRDYNNAASIAAKGDIIFLLNDDVVIETEDWDLKIYEFYQANKPSDDIMLIGLVENTKDVYHNNNGIGHGVCFPVVTKTYINMMRGVFPPDIKMWFADTAISRIFTSINRVWLLDSVKVFHDSYHAKTRPKDPININIEKINTTQGGIKRFEPYIAFISNHLNKN